MMANIKMMQVRRGSSSIFVKFTYAYADFKEYSRLLTNSYRLDVLPPPKPARGPQASKKEEIAEKLVNLMPPNRRAFWLNLPSCASSADLAVEPPEHSEM